MKFYIRQVNSDSHSQQGNALNSLNTSNIRSCSNRLNETNKPDLIFNVESVSEPLQVITIKNFISQNTNSKIENVSLFINPYIDQDSSYGLSDEFDVFKLFHNKSLSTNFLSIAGTFNTLNTQKDNNPTLYFKLLTDIPVCKIIIEYFLTNIDKILMEVSTNCSIFILKYLIRKKLLIPENEQNLIDLNTQKMFKNDEIIANLLSPCDNSIRLNNSQINNSTSALHKEDNSNIISSHSEFHLINNYAKMLRIQLIRKGNRRCSIGIDFSFNILKDIKKIDFTDDAPSFREASDGMNLFCYCKNKYCKICDELFVKNIGFGKFDLLKEIAFIKCPLCKMNKIEARNLGFINCEWSYRGYLTNKKNCCTSGDGITIDDKLYILSEVSLSQCIEKLEINIKEKSFVQQNPTKKKIPEEIDSEGDIDYDSIGLESIRSNNLKASNLFYNPETKSLIKNHNIANNISYDNNHKNINIESLKNNTNYDLSNKPHVNDSTNFLIHSKTNCNLIKSRTQEIEIITEKNPKCEIGNCMNFLSKHSNTCPDEKFKNEQGEKKKDNCLIF